MQRKSERNNDVRAILYGESRGDPFGFRLGTFPRVEQRADQIQYAAIVDVRANFLHDYLQMREPLLMETAPCFFLLIFAKWLYSTLLPEPWAYR